MNDAQRLSRILFMARESIEMWADTVETRTGRIDQANRRLINEIDTYRSERGWNLYGFGREEEETKN